MLQKVDFFIMGEVCYMDPAKSNKTKLLKQNSLPSEIIEHDLDQMNL